MTTIKTPLKVGFNQLDRSTHIHNSYIYYIYITNSPWDLLVVDVTRPDFEPRTTYRTYKLYKLIN